MLAVSSLGPVTCNCHDYLITSRLTNSLATKESSLHGAHCLRLPEVVTNSLMAHCRTQFQSNPYGIKDTSPSTEMSAWTSASLQSTTGYYSYDPTLAAYG